MAGANEVRAGGAYVELGVKDSLDKGLKSAEDRLKSFGKGIAIVGAGLVGLGASITAPLIAAAKASAETGAKLYDMSKRTGVSVEALSSLSYAADLTSTDLDSVEKSIRIMQKTISGVKDDVEGTTGALGHLGITAEDIKGKRPEEQFAIIAEKIRGISDPSEKAAAALKVFGRAGTQLLPLIDQFDELSTEAKKLGLIKTAESAKQGKELEDEFIKASKASKSLIAALAAGVIPVLIEKTKTLRNATLALRDFVRENKGFIAIAFKVGTVLTIVGTGLIVLGGAIALAGKSLGVLRVGLALIPKLFAAILSPMGLVIVALGVATVALLKFTNVGQKILGYLTKQFGGLASSAGTASEKIVAALKVGDLKGVTAAIKEWVDQNKEAFQTLGQIALKAAIVVTSLIALATAWKVGTTSFLAAKIALKAIIPLFAALTSPLGIIAALLIGGAAAWLYWSDSGHEAIKTVTELLGTLSGIVQDTMGGIVDAILAGDIPGAIDVLWAGAKASWYAGIAPLNKSWANFTKTLTQYAQIAFAGIQAAWESVSNALEVAWIETTAFLGNIWDGFVSTVQSAWDTVAGVLKKSFNELKGIWDSLFGEGNFDVDAANKKVDDDIAAAEAARQKKDVDDATKREKERADKRAARAEENRKTNEKIATDFQEKFDAAGSNAATDVAQATADARDARKNLDDARKKAKDERAESDKKKKEDKRKEPETKKPPEVPTLSGEAAKAESRQQVGGLNVELALGGPQLDATKKTADNTAQTVTAIEALPEQIAEAIGAAEGGASGGADTSSAGATEAPAPLAGEKKTEDKPLAAAIKAVADAAKGQAAEPPKNTIDPKLRSAILPFADAVKKLSENPLLKSAFAPVLAAVSRPVEVAKTEKQQRDERLTSGGLLTESASARERIAASDAAAKARRDKLGPRPEQPVDIGALVTEAKALTPVRNPLTSSAFAPIVAAISKSRAPQAPAVPGVSLAEGQRSAEANSQRVAETVAQKSADAIAARNDRLNNSLSFTRGDAGQDMIAALDRSTEAITLNSQQLSAPSASLSAPAPGSADVAGDTAALAGSMQSAARSLKNIDKRAGPLVLASF